MTGSIMQRLIGKSYVRRVASFGSKIHWDSLLLIKMIKMNPRMTVDVRYIRDVHSM